MIPTHLWAYLRTALAVFALLAVQARPTPAVAADNIVIGVLYAVDPGDTVSTRAAAAAVAGDIINEYFTNSGIRAQVRLEMVDTGENPAAAVAAAQAMYAKGIRIIVGPQSSAEVEAISTLPIARDMVMISYASTAPSVADPNYTLFRMAPNDIYQAEALSALFESDGIDTIIPIFVDDVYGRDLVAEVRRQFTARGGRVLAGASYLPDESPAAAVAQAAVQARSDVAGGRTAVLAVSLTQIAHIMAAANDSGVLNTIRWYGTDSSAMNREVLLDPEVGAFAWRTGFTASLYGEFPSTLQTELVAQLIRDRTEMAPEPYALTAYDSVILAALAASEAADLTPASLGPALMAEAADFYGVTGRVVLDENGDRVAGSYDFWTVNSRGGSLTWSKTGTYTFEPGRAGELERLGALPGVTQLPSLPNLPDVP